MEDDEILSVTDPNKLTIAQLKSKLSAAGVQLSMAKEKKEYYVDQFTKLQEHKRKELEAKQNKKRGADDTEGADEGKKKKPKTEDSETAATPSKKKTSKRRKSNPFQSGSDDSGEEEKAPTKKRSLASSKETPTKSKRSQEPDTESKDDVIEAPVSKKKSPAKKETEKKVAEETNAPSTSQEETSTTPPTAIEKRTSVTVEEVSFSSPLAEATPISSATRRRLAPSDVSSPVRSTVTTTTTTTSTPNTTSATVVRRSRITTQPTESGVNLAPSVSTTPRRTRITASSAVPSSSISNREATPYRRAIRPDTKPETSVPTEVPSAILKRISPLKEPRVKTEEETKEEIEESTEVSAPTEPHDIFSILFLCFVISTWVFLVGFLIFYVPFNGKLPELIRPNPEKFCSPDVEYPGCIPCPPHGTCRGGTLTCDVGFTRSGKTCIENKADAKAAAKFITAMEKMLSKLNGRYECLEVSRRFLNEAEMKQYLQSLSLCSAGDFERIFTKAKDIILSSTYNSETPVQIIVSRENVEFGMSPEIMDKPFICAVKGWLASMKWYFLGLLVIFGFVLYLLRMKRQAEEEKEQVNKLVEEVYELLKEQRAHAQSHDNILRTEPYIGVTHIRDTLIKPPANKVKRDRLWNKVQKIISADTRVQEVVVSEFGEPCTVWQWTAPVRATDLFSPRKTDFSMMPRSMDEGATSAVEKRYPDIYPAREFRKQ